ncbi:MAG: hypothetical protein HY700_13160 [Gemmatimonadetes bacterium]|nr:hypothetical protein [Gemmatimonadota bacterium]
MRAAVISCSLFSAVACAGGSPQTPGTSYPPVAPAAVQSVKYTAGTNRFRAVSHVHQRQEIQGNVQDGNYILEYFFTTALSPEPPGRLRMGFTIDSMHAEGGLITPAEMARAKGVRMSGTLNPDGQVTELTGDSALTGQLQSIASAARQFLPRIPANGAEPGAQWSDTTEISTGGPTQLTIRSVNDRRALEWMQYAGRRSLRIEVTSNYTLTGTGQQMGQDFTLTGKGARAATQYLSADGHYLGATSRDSSDITVTLSSMGMTFPSIQVRTDTVAVLP